MVQSADNSPRNGATGGNFFGLDSQPATAEAPDDEQILEQEDNMSKYYIFWLDKKEDMSDLIHQYKDID